MLWGLGFVAFIFLGGGVGGGRNWAKLLRNVPLRCGIVVLQNRGEFANPIAASNIHMKYRFYSVF